MRLFLRSDIFGGNEQFMWHRAIRGWYPCYDYLINEEGKVDVDILSFEKLDENICEYFKLKSLLEKEMLQVFVMFQLKNYILRKLLI